MADFDGDGALDLAVGDASADAVGVFLGDGLGGFFPGSSAEVGDSPRAVLAGDFNGDHKSDLAVASTLDDTVSVLLNDGTGVLVRSQEIGVSLAPTALASADLDHDGTLDLVVANRDAGTLSVLLGGESGEFVRRQDTIRVGEEPESVAAGDFDLDGDTDLAVANHDGDGLSILHGDGSGGLSRSDVTGIPRPSSVASGDLDEDGLLDLAVASSTRGSVMLLRGQGPAGFVQGLELSVGKDPKAVVIGDLNEDGVPDLAALDGETGTMIVFLQGQDGAYLRQPALAVGDDPQALAMGDFDGDDRPDLVVTDAGGDSATLLTNQLEARGDVNGSGRIDGFDVSAVSLAAGCALGSPCYRRSADVDLNGLVDGHDLTWIASRFGALVGKTTRLRAGIAPPPVLPGEGTVSFQEGQHEGDLLRVQVIANDDNDGVAGAHFGVVYDPQVLEYVRAAKGTYLGGALEQVLTVAPGQAGRLSVAVARLPNQNTLGRGRKPLVDLFFRPRAPGQTALQFVSTAEGEAMLVDASGRPVPGVLFSGGAIALVTGPLLASTVTPGLPSPGTVSLQSAPSSGGDLIALQVVADTRGRPAAEMSFTVSFDPAVVEPAQIEPGAFFGDGADRRSRQTAPRQVASGSRWRQTPAGTSSVRAPRW